MENYILKKISTSNSEFVNKVEVLDSVLGIRKKASKLSKEKCTTPTSQDNGPDNRNARSKGSMKIKSKRYIEYVMEQREKLKEYGVCEASCKNILKYSNNLVHRLLKYDPENRNSLITGAKSKTKGRKTKLTFETLMTTKCCHHVCTKLIGEYPQYYSNLRAEAQKCNKNKRTAIKELIFFSLNQRKICNKFIIQVLGVSRDTLKTVKKNWGSLVIHVNQQLLLSHNQ
ncbi:hypothetical protein RF11_03940 [Thelohanellus kitauei]|uniref:Uncharacterized protein n=1 Tax=Thelohanellus kitauei TaxID=669202 RepID=A0A0C2NC07_THEKT|nr:hypothetical protein RF11_03940 [Thelohanellus kitauei]